MKTIKSVIIFVILFFVFDLGMKLSALAYEPPTPKLENAMKNGEAMFVGRVVGLEEIQRYKFKTIAKARVILIHCFFGIKCKNNNEIFFRYYSDTLEEGIFSINLSISREILFILKESPNKGEFLFDSNLTDGVDFAFEVDVEDVMTNFQNKFLSDSDSIRLTNLYWEKHQEWISKSDIEEIVKNKTHKE